MRRWRRCNLDRGMERQRTKRQNGHKERLASQRDGQGKVTQGQTDRGTEKRVILREGGGEVETVAEIYCEGKLVKKPIYFICLGCVVSDKYFQTEYSFISFPVLQWLVDTLVFILRCSLPKSNAENI